MESETFFVLSHFGKKKADFEQGRGKMVEQVRFF